MKLFFSLSISLLYAAQSIGQVMTPELLWSLKRISPIGLSNDGQSVIYAETIYDASSNSKETKTYSIPIGGGEPEEVPDYSGIYTDPDISPDGRSKLTARQVKLTKVFGSDFYPDMKESDVYIYDRLDYRHWDKWEDGSYSHVFILNTSDPERNGIDIMEGETYDCPQQPFGGSEDYIWNPDGSQVIYVSKKKFGTAYAISTNTDLYAYDVKSKKTTNLTEDNPGYDMNPAFSSTGMLAYTQMEEDGYESDKNDLVILEGGQKTNLTKDWDETVLSFAWDNSGTKILFIAPIAGTKQLFETSLPKKGKAAEIKQLTDGQFDITGIVGQSKNTLVVTRTDMNHATEIYTLDMKKGKLSQLTHANDQAYSKIKMGEVKKRMIKTMDGKDMTTWIIYPPDFDPSKKYPTLLYCQGGPQSPLSQFYSFRWNFQLMAANGYIIVAPNRRGMPGHGVEWNEQISGDYGGQNMKDYLSAIDELAKEEYVDKDKLGCVGASYGGYSAFYLMGTHEGRFKTFIAHDGIFNWRSMFGTTEEIFFANKDMGGPYWDEKFSKSYNEFNPISKVNNWDTPILIIQGGKDYRVPIGQGLEAFQAAQLKGLRSKLLYFPEENHWILSAQNGIIWQREFFSWLDEFLK